MFTQAEMQELLAYESGGDDVVSLYLDTDSSQQSVEAIKLQARSLLKELPGDHETESTAIERYLDLSYNWSSDGLAIFCNHDGEFFRAFASPVAFRNRVRLGLRPYVKPLTHLLDHYAHFGVILVDQVGGRFYEYHLGELQGSSEFNGEDVRKVKSGHGSTAHGRRSGGQSGPGGSAHEDEVVNRNLRDTAASADRFFKNRNVRRLFLGGTAENVAKFRELLSKQLQTRLAGTLSIDVDAGESEVRRRALALLQEVNAEREAALVKQMIALKSQGTRAVVGLDDTLQAVSDRRVETLLVSDGYRHPGYHHTGSGFVVSNLARSPLSDQEMTEVKDIVETAVAQTVEQGGHVEVIADNAALDHAGRIGAILRY